MTWSLRILPIRTFNHREKAVTVDATSLIIAAVGSTALAVIVTWLIAGRRLNAERAALNEQREQRARAEITLQTVQAAHAEQMAALQNADQRMREAFTSLSNDALRASSEQFLQLAEERMQRQQQATKSDLNGLVEPLRETLSRQAEQVRVLEANRQNAYGSLDTLLKELRQDQLNLRTQTETLAQSLRNPRVRGQWGEIQLRRLIELTGMLEHCDFTEQQRVTGDEKRLRPDLIVHLPGRRQVVVDAKVPLERFLDALEAAEPERSERLREYARSVRGHVDEMARRAYHEHVPNAHEFTVIFLPGEVFYQTALEFDHQLLEHSFAKGVIIASPSTLIALLKSAAMGWREAQLADEAHKIQQLGAELYDRLNTVAGHISKLGKSLEQSVKTYNQLVGSTESRLLASARRMHDMGIGTNDLPELVSLSETARVFSRAELQAVDVVPEVCAAD